MKDWNENEKYNSLEHVLATLSPTNWKEILFYPMERVHQESCPMLKDFVALYGLENGELFIQTQMLACYGLPSNQDSAATQQIKTYAGVFCSFARYSKMSEIALFFGRYSTGAYDRKTNFSAREVSQAWKKFIDDWANECQGYADIGEEVKPAAPSLVRKNSYERYLRTSFYAEHDLRPKVKETCQKLLESTLTKDGIVPLLNYEQRKSAEEFLDKVFQDDDAKGGRFSVINNPTAAGGTQGYYQYAS